MNKLILTILGLCSTVITIFAQDYVQVAVGAGYSKQAYYRLSDDAVTQIANESWDLAFSTTGTIDVGISVNESTTSVTGAPAPELALFLTSATNFAETIDTSKFVKRLYNDETSWTEGGALNIIADPENPFDFGWGLYNLSNHTLTGNRIFAVKLRDNTYKKFIIESFAGGAYNLKYANFDGSEEKTVAIKKGDFSGNPIALFSFETGETLAPLGAWDLMFCRYVTPLDDGAGNILDYPVTGVLSGHNVETVEVKGIDPNAVTYNTYVDSFQTKLDIIGYDWKTFSFTQGWVIPTDLAYFVKTAENRIYKLVFVDFEGSTTGISTFEKTDLGILSSVNNPNSNFKEATVYPNPKVSEATLAFTLKQNQNNLQLAVRDLTGRMIWNTLVDGNQGLNAIQLPSMNLPQGMYLLSVGRGKDSITLKLIQQ
ncbi:MAG: T9SS type A sorting domain-containing protein [Saprospiraceae bacterium]|nr:T9SS type A sorting domain-containing protein [Saprospiraceae bacterium]